MSLTPAGALSWSTDLGRSLDEGCMAMAVAAAEGVALGAVRARRGTSGHARNEEIQ